MEEATALIALSRIVTISNAAKKVLAEDGQGLVAIFEGREKAQDRLADEAISSFKGFEAIERDLAALSRMGVDLVTIKDSTYPPALAAIPDAPLVLYKKGPLPFPRDAFAIVGARKASFEGILLAERIAETLSSAGITVVSGLARGIDGAAHKGALRGKGKTAGVLGCGIDICYPAENRRLFDDIGLEGVVLTEYRPGEPPYPSHFPERNRIIAGLSAGVLVVEASRKSGSLITARLALDYGREVMAVPGRVFDEAYQGANSLIKKGAHLVEEIGDILSCCFPNLQAEMKSAIDLDGDEDYIFRLLGGDRVHVDELIEKSRLETRRVMAILTRLEMKDMVSSVPGGFYLRKI